MARLKDTLERAMFYNASPLIFERAKILRNNLTEAEKRLWSFLSNRQMIGLHFRRQHPINRFIADFYCHTIKLIIEVDGVFILTKIGKNTILAAVQKSKNGILKFCVLQMSRFYLILKQ